MTRSTYFATAQPSSSSLASPTSASSEAHADVGILDGDSLPSPSGVPLSIPSANNRPRPRGRFVTLPGAPGASATSSSSSFTSTKAPRGARRSDAIPLLSDDEREDRGVESELGEYGNNERKRTATLPPPPAPASSSDSPSSCPDSDEVLVRRMVRSALQRSTTVTTATTSTSTTRDVEAQFTAWKEGRSREAAIVIPDSADEEEVEEDDQDGEGDEGEDETRSEGRKAFVQHLQRFVASGTRSTRDSISDVSTTATDSAKLGRRKRSAAEVPRKGRDGRETAKLPHLDRRVRSDPCGIRPLGIDPSSSSSSAFQASSAPLPTAQLLASTTMPAPIKQQHQLAPRLPSRSFVKASELLCESDLANRASFPASSRQKGPAEEEEGEGRDESVELVSLPKGLGRISADEIQGGKGKGEAREGRRAKERSASPVKKSSASRPAAQDREKEPLASSSMPKQTDQDTAADSWDSSDLDLPNLPRLAATAVTASDRKRRKKPTTTTSAKRVSSAATATQSAAMQPEGVQQEGRPPHKRKRRTRLDILAERHEAELIKAKAKEQAQAAATAAAADGLAGEASTGEEKMVSKHGPTKSRAGQRGKAAGAAAAGERGKGRSGASPRKVVRPTTSAAEACSTTPSSSSDEGEPAAAGAAVSAAPDVEPLDVTFLPSSTYSLLSTCPLCALPFSASRFRFTPARASHLSLCAARLGVGREMLRSVVKGEMERVGRRMREEKERRMQNLSTWDLLLGRDAALVEEEQEQEQEQDEGDEREDAQAKKKRKGKKTGAARATSPLKPGSTSGFTSLSLGATTNSSSTGRLASSSSSSSLLSRTKQRQLELSLRAVGGQTRLMCDLRTARQGKAETWRRMRRLLGDDDEDEEGGGPDVGQVARQEVRDIGIGTALDDEASTTSKEAKSLVPRPLAAAAPPPSTAQAQEEQLPLPSSTPPFGISKLGLRSRRKAFEHRKRRVVGLGFDASSDPSTRRRRNDKLGPSPASSTSKAMNEARAASDLASTPAPDPVTGALGRPSARAWKNARCSTASRLGMGMSLGRGIAKLYRRER